MVERVSKTSGWSRPGTEAATWVRAGTRESPVLGEQESIWEGPVTVTGSVTGRGYQELVSYARERKRKSP